jgi:hypothetical protein
MNPNNENNCPACNRPLGGLKRCIAADCPYNEHSFHSRDVDQQEYFTSLLADQYGIKGSLAVISVSSFNHNTYNKNIVDHDVIVVCNDVNDIHMVILKTTPPLEYEQLCTEKLIPKLNIQPMEILKPVYTMRHRRKRIN